MQHIILYCIYSLLIHKVSHKVYMHVINTGTFVLNNNYMFTKDLQHGDSFIIPKVGIKLI